MRIVLKGTSGAGKTTLGRELAARLGVPVIELDGLYHGPNWVGATADELRARVDAALEGHDAWIVDGNYDTKLGDIVVGRADLVVWLDLPLAQKLARVLRRTWRRVTQQQVLWNGNRETWSGALLAWDGLIFWTVRSHVKQRRTWPARFAGRRMVRLRSEAEVAAWLATMPTR